jgi:hypothetical protein
MYYAKTRADNSGYINHRVTCLVVMSSPFDNEQVGQVSFHWMGIKMKPNIQPPPLPPQIIVF